MSSIPCAAEIAADARWLTQALDAGAGRVRLIAMDRAAYRSASFLDDRMLQAPRDARVVPWADVAGAMLAGARRDARWIFHIGHVGSTLIARLFGELDGVLAVREPRILRDIALLPPDQRAPLTKPVRRLLSRTFAPGETALVKATSFVSEIAPELVSPGERALFLFATPRNYIASILAGDNSRKELAMLADSRRKRLAERGIIFADAGRSEAHVAAAAWACEMTGIEAAAAALPDRALAWGDFDRQIDSLPAELARLADFFGFTATPDQLASIADGPLMTRYPRRSNTPTARRCAATSSPPRRAHRTEIDGALAMLTRASEKCPLLTQALDRAHPES